MKVSFRHANPHRGNESTLLRFEESSPAHSHTPCLLIDSGPGVDIDSVLADDEYLIGILLTHAHSDHYATLGDNIRDGASVYAAPDTAAILNTVIGESHQHAEETISDTVVDSLVSLDGWETLYQSLRVRAIPAGHAPGAAGFLIQFEDNGDQQTILATGDFTETRVGGYPAFDAELPLSVDALVLSGVTATDTSDDVMDALTTAVELANAGSRVLLSTTGLSAVTYAYRLGHLAKELDAAYSVVILGHAAKLYTQLGYDVPNVRPVTNFADPDPHFREGQIAIAGPQVPNEGASGQLFECIKSDSNAALVQLTNGADDPIQSATCTVTSATDIAHPTEDAIDAVVEQLDPTEVVVTHQTGHALERYRDKYTSYVWAGDSTDWYTFYEDRWLAPPWMTRRGKEHVESATTLEIDGLAESFDYPEPTRGGIDLAAEGIDCDAFRSVTHTPATPTTPNGAPEAAEELSITGHDAPASPATDGGLVVEQPTTPEPSTESEETTAQARVVDAGDGVKLLRLTDLPDGASLTHGDDLTISFEAD